MKLFRRTLVAAVTFAALGANFSALAQDIKPRLIRFGKAWFDGVSIGPGIRGHLRLHRAILVRRVDPQRGSME